jgi:hypothetical protein
MQELLDARIPLWLGAAVMAAAFLLLFDSPVIFLIVRPGKQRLGNTPRRSRMRRTVFTCVIGIALTSSMIGCGGSSSGGGGTPPPPPLVSYVGTTGVFAAWATATLSTVASGPIGSYAAKRQSLHGSVDFVTGTSLSQPAGIEVYKGSDGHIYELDLTSTFAPVAQQLSSETAATVDDTCSFTGTTAGAGATYDYAGIFFAADLQSPTNSSYVYRLPGPDGVCDTPDDIFHMVKTGMSATTAPIVAKGVPVAAVHNATGGLTGFVVKSGANLVLVDSNFANPANLGTFAATIGVAVALPLGTTQGYPTGQLYVVDGNIVYVNYTAQTVSASLYTIPNWTTVNPAATFAASPTTLYFAINTPGTKTTPAATTIYSMPANGSVAPTAIDTEPGRVVTLVFPVNGSNIIWGVENTGAGYTIKTLPQTGGNPATLITDTNNDGTFFATASTIYYTTWTGTVNSTTLISTRTLTQTGIVAVNNTVIQAPLANSTFLTGGEAEPWPNDTITTVTPTITVFQIQGLTPVTVTDTSTGWQYTADAVSGGTIVAIDATSNQPGVTIGTLPSSTAMFLSDVFRGNGDTGFIEATTSISTQEPGTRDLYILNSTTAGSLARVTNNL